MLKQRVVTAAKILDFLSRFERANTHEISMATGISVSHVEQTIHPMKKEGIVTATRGPGGGYSILRRDITVADLITIYYPFVREMSGFDREVLEALRAVPVVTEPVGVLTS